MRINPLRFSSILLYLVILANAFISCQKQGSDIAEQVDPRTNLTDSASYTIDGKLYTCDVLSSSGRGNLKANWDSVSRRWDTDTIMYYSDFGLTKKPGNDRSNDGNITVLFIKNYNRRDMVSSPNVPALLQPQQVSDHYLPGRYHFATDFESHNRKNGIKLILQKGNATESEMFSTTLTNSNTATYQDDASFQITRFTSIGNNGRYLIEAKFDANVFNANGTASRVENGYLRFKL